MGKRHDKEWIFALTRAMQERSSQVQPRELQSPHPIPQSQHEQAIHTSSIGRKLEGLVVQGILLTLLMAWLILKYPELIDRIIPWIILCVLWYLTWAFVLDTKTVKGVFSAIGNRLSRKTIWPLTLLLVGGISLLYWQVINTSLTRLASIARQPTAPKHFVTLKDLFESDWPDLLGWYNEGTINSPLLSHQVKVEWRLNGDFEARSKFLAIFIDPDVPASNMVVVCQAIADNYGQMVSGLNSDADITIQSPDAPAPTRFKDLVFSGRIFIYYDDPTFSLQQKAQIASLFEQRGLSVEFRGDEYRWLHKDDQALLRKLDLKPNTMILPDPKKIPPLV